MNHGTYEPTIWGAEIEAGHVRARNLSRIKTLAFFLPNLGRHHESVRILTIRESRLTPFQTHGRLP